MRKAFNLKLIVSGDIERYKIYEKPFKLPNNNGYTGERGHAKNPEKSQQQAVARARQKIHGYIMANDWDYWATQTFNPQKIDRFNLDAIIKRYNQKLRDLKRRKYNNLQWLIVPEQHKNEAWHLHMFMSGIPQDKIVYSGRDYYNKKNQFVRRVYNWTDTIDYGFNDYLYIGDCDPLERLKMANYITKYITKELAQSRFNKKMYWNSRDLAEPTVINTLTNNIDRLVSNTIIAENEYLIKNPETGEIFNSVRDVIIYNDIPF